MDQVPGMAEAVERRANQLGLSPGEFAAAARLTGPGLDPVRNGVRKNYAAKTRRGVAHALRWPLDWYDRILAGEDASRFPDTSYDVPDEDRLTALEREVRELARAVADIAGRLRD